VLVNLGGIANVSVVPPNASFSDIVSTDTGTANTYLDAMVHRHIKGHYYDANGNIAAKGQVHKGLLSALLKHPFLSLPAPKTTGQEAFSIDWLDTQMRVSDTQNLPLANLLATLAEFCAVSVCDAIKQIVPLQQQQSLALYASGGGANNRFLLSRIQAHLPQASIAPMGDLGISADAKEAALFALLANECLCGTPDTFENSSGAPNVSMGKISLPN
jgi:anhydro-N-acetylmuramic acid kinase